MVKFMKKMCRYGKMERWEGGKVGRWKMEDGTKIGKQEKGLAKLKFA